MSPDLHSLPWKSRSNILPNDLDYLWLNTCYRLDFSIDFNIIEVEELNKSEINNVAMMVDLKNNINFKRIGLTLKIKVNRQGQVTELGLFEFLDIENVRIDTKIGSIACTQPEMSKVIGKMCMTLSSKVSRLRYVNYLNIFYIPGLENVRIDTKIMSYDVYNQRYERSYTNVFDLHLQGQPSRSGDWFWVFWDSRHCKC